MGVKITKGDLAFKASLDDDDVEKAGDRIIKKFNDILNASKKADGSAIVNREVTMRAKVTAAIEKQTVANKKLADQVKKTEISNSQSEIDAYLKSRNGDISTNMTAVNPKEVDYAKITNAATTATAAQQKLNQTVSTGRVEVSRQGVAIDSLKLKLQSYQNIANAATDPARRELYNKKVQETSLEITRMSNVGKEGFDRMGNAIKGNTNLLGKLWGGLKFAANILPGLGVAGILAFALGPILEYIAKLDIFGKKVTEAAEKLKILNEINQSANKDAGAKISTLKILYATAINEAESTKRRTEAAKELQKQFPAAFANSKTQAILNGQEKKSYDDLSASILATSRAKAAKDKLDEIEAKRLDISFQREKIKNANANEKARAEKDLVARANNVNKNYTQQQEKFKITDDQIQKQIELATKSANERASIADKEQETLDKRLESQSKFLMKYAGQGNIADTLITKTPKVADDKSIERADSLLRKIENLKQEYSRKSQSDDEAELQAVRDKFANIALEVEKFNNNKKNKVKIAPEGLNELRDTVISDLVYKQNTAKLSIELDKQKDVYSQYESYKEQLGKDSADKRFENEKAAFDNYGEYLKSKMSEFDGMDVSSMTGSQRERYESLKKQSEEFVVSEKQKQDQRFIQALQDTNSFEQNKKTIEEKYRKKKDDLLGLPADEYAKRTAEYDRQKKEEIDAAKDTAFQKLEIYEKLNEDIAYYTKEQIKVQIQSLEEFLKAASGLSPELRSQLEKELQSAKSKLGNTNDDNFTKDLQAQKDVILKNLDINELGTKEYQKQFQKLQQINTELKKATSAKFGKISSDLSAISSVADQLSEAFEGVNETVSESLRYVGELSSIGSSAAGGIASFASGDILGGITQSVTAITGVMKLVSSTFKVSKEQREAQDRATAQYYRNVFAGEKEYERMMRARLSIQENITELTIRELDARKEMLGGQSKDVQADYDELLERLQRQGRVAKQVQEGFYYKYTMSDSLKRGIDDKAALDTDSYDELLKLYMSGRMNDATKVIFEQLRASKEELEGITEASKEAEEALSKIRTGTTASDLANSLSDMFKNGKTDVKDFAEFLESTMKDAFYSTFKNDVLNKETKAWYDQFNELSKDGLTSTERLALEQSFREMNERANVKLKELQESTGMSFDAGKETSSNSTKGAYSTASQESISLLAGHTSAMRLAQLKTNEILETHHLTARQHLDIAMQGINHLKMIEQHTGKTAENTGMINEEIKSLNRVISKNNDSARAAGFNP